MSTEGITIEPMYGPRTKAQAEYMARLADAFNKLPRRVEGSGFIRWYRDNKLVREVRAADYYAEQPQFGEFEYAPMELPR